MCPQIADLANFKDVVDFHILPAMNRSLAVIEKDHSLLWWANRYRRAMVSLLEKLQWSLEERARAVNANLATVGPPRRSVRERRRGGSGGVREWWSEGVVEWERRCPVV
jgi:hypothetical protein